MVSTRNQTAKAAKLEARVTTVAAWARAVTPLLFLLTKLQLDDFLASSRATKRLALGVESLHITIKDKSSLPFLDFPPLDGIMQLSVPFDVGDIHFAHHIAGAMPQLILLEVIKKPCQQHIIRSHAWSNVVEWSRHRALMRNLKTLRLLT
ncbi:hypothetical protein BDR05DRAFT_953541 [Suillus weaverae]|nr:hypothetical protein BDR05DRAFT_953541 [Suillus weaverae]